MSSIILPDTVSYDENSCELVIIDQTLLPGSVKLLRLSDADEIRSAILRLSVRGAPAIGVAAAIGLAVCAMRISDEASFDEELEIIAKKIRTARPTAVNLEWAVARVMRSAAAEATPKSKKAALIKEALIIRDEDIAMCRSIGEHGLTLIKDGDSILTHCNAGQLAAVRYGTALAPIHVGLERGMHFKVYTDETRPLLQGMRLSAFETAIAGADVTVLCDNMAASLMSEGKISAVFVGADRVATNGDTANKIGTHGLAIIARHFGVPFYVCVPSSTIDSNTPTGADINIEQRISSEVTDLWFENRMAPHGVSVYNPAFDVTPANLITAFVTERGIYRSAAGLL